MTFLTSLHPVGETFTKRYVFTAERIKSVATAVGDTNPWHHDDAAAARSRFGKLIASAGHSTGIFVSVIADHTTREGTALGLEFTYKLKRAVPVGLDALITWRVTGKEPSHKLGGDIIKLEGTMTDDNGRIYLEGSGFVLVMPPQAPT